MANKYIEIKNLTSVELGGIEGGESGMVLAGADGKHPADQYWRKRIEDGSAQLVSPRAKAKSEKSKK